MINIHREGWTPQELAIIAYENRFGNGNISPAQNFTVFKLRIQELGFKITDENVFRKSYWDCDLKEYKQKHGLVV